MAANLRPQDVIGDVLVIAPGDEDHLLLEARSPAMVRLGLEAMESL